MIFIQKLIFELLLSYPTWLMVIDIIFTSAIVIAAGYIIFAIVRYKK